MHAESAAAADSALAVGTPGAACEAIPPLTEALKAAGYAVPSPPKLVQATPASTGWAAKGGRAAAPAARAAGAAAKGGAVKGGVARPAAAPKAAGGAVSKGGGTAAKGGLAAKGGAAKGGAAKPAAAPAAKVGSVKETSLAIEPAKPGMPVALTLKLTPGMALAASDSITFSLPGFTGASGDLEVSVPDAGEAAASSSRLTAKWDADASKLVVEVAAEQEPLPKGVPFSLVIAQGLSSPEQGLSPAAGITISSDAKEGAVASVAIEHVPTVKGCKYTADVHGGMIQLGRLLLQGGPRAMADYNCVAYKCFLDVARDVEGVEGREKTLLLAILCADIALRSQPFAVDAAHGGVTAGSFKTLHAAVEEVGLPYSGTSADVAGGEGGGDGTDTEAKVKGWVKEMKKLVEADEKMKEGFRATLSSWERLVVVDRWLACDDHEQAGKELELLAPGLATGRDGIVTMYKARILQREYLHLVNSNPDLPLLHAALEKLAAAWSAAAAVAEREGAAGAGGGCRASVCWVACGQAREELKHLAYIYTAAGKKGKLAGEDQEATDQANLDEVAGLMKQRGVFGTPSVEETIKEMEDEYHDNIRFGLSDAADTVSNLLEWYRDYRTRLARGGTMYANKSEAPKEDPAIAQALKEAKEHYGKAVGLLAAVSASSAPADEALRSAQEGLGRVLFFTNELDAAVTALSKLSEGSAPAALYHGLAKMQHDEARGFATDGPALLPVLERVFKAVGVLAKRLKDGDHAVVEHFEMLCSNGVRLSNPLVHQGAIKLGDHLLQAGRSKEAVTLLRDAVEGLVVMVATGVSQSAKAQAKIWEGRARVQLVKNLDAAGDKAGAMDQALKIEEALKYANKGDGESLDRRLANAELAVSVAPSWAVSWAIRGDVLWAIHEYHPTRKREAALLDDAEEAYKKAISLEGQAKAPLPGPKPPAPSGGAGAPAGARSPAASPPAAARGVAARGVASKGGAAKGGSARPTTSAGSAVGGGGSLGGGGGNNGGAGANGKIAGVRIGLAKIMAERLGEVVADPMAIKEEDRNALVQLYEEAISIDARDVEPYYKVGELLELKCPQRAAEVYAKYPANFEAPNLDDAFIAGEVVRLSLRGKDYLKWTKGGAEVLNVAKGLVVMAKVNGLDMISSYVEKLEGANQTEILCEVYAAVNNRATDDPEMKAYYHRKGWVTGAAALQQAIEHARLMHPLM